MLRSKRKTEIKFNNPFFGLLQFLLTHKSFTWHIFMTVKNYIQRMLPRYLKLRWKWLVIIMSRGTVWNCHSLPGAGRKCKAVAAVLLSTSSPFYRLISSRKGETGDKICKELTHKGIDCSLKKKNHEIDPWHNRACSSPKNTLCVQETVSWNGFVSHLWKLQKKKKMMTTCKYHVSKSYESISNVAGAS